MVEFASKSFLHLFVAVDPFGLLPLLMLLVRSRALGERIAVARRTILISAVVLLGFMLVGSMLLHLMQMSLDGLRLAGGLLLFKVALDMVFDGGSMQHLTNHGDIALFPLAIPFVVGPATLTNLLILQQEIAGEPLKVIALVGVLLSVLTITFGLMWLVSRAVRPMGPASAYLLSRVGGLLLAILAVEYALAGLKGLWQNF